MVSFTELAVVSTVLAVAHGHGVILNAQGIQGSPASVAFKGKLLKVGTTSPQVNPIPLTYFS
jgi:hypothetical protein